MERANILTKTKKIKKKIRFNKITNNDNLDKIGEKTMCRFFNFLHPDINLSKNPSAPIFPNPIEPIPYPLPPPLPPQF
jgi:hypothetical protein